MEIDAAIFAQNVPLPRFSDHFSWRIVAGFLAGHVDSQPIKGSNDRLTGHIRAEAYVLDQCWQETTHRLVLGVQLLIIDIVGWSDQRIDAFERQREGVAWNLLEQTCAQITIRQTGVQQHLAGAGQRSRRLIQILERAQSRFLVCLDGVTKQFTQEYLQHFQSIVLCAGFQAMHEGNQGGQAAWIRQAKDGADLGGTRKPGQGRHTGCGNTSRSGQSDAQFAHRVQSHERDNQGSAAHHDGAFA